MREDLTWLLVAGADHREARVATGIVGHADLCLGDGVAEVLEAHVAAGGGRFRGIRHSATWDPSSRRYLPIPVLVMA